MPDPSITTKFCSAEWLPDGRSFAYLDFGHDGKIYGTGTGALSGGRLKIHRLGEPSEQDQQVLAFPENDQIFPSSQVIGGGRFLAVTITEGTDSRNRLWLYPLEDVGGRSVLGEPITIIDEAVAEMLPIEFVDGRLYLETDLDAPRGRIVWTDPARPLDGHGRPVLTEVHRPGEDTLLAVEAIGGGIAGPLWPTSAPWSGCWTGTAPYAIAWTWPVGRWSGWRDASMIMALRRALVGDVARLGVPGRHPYR